MTYCEVKKKTLMNDLAVNISTGVTQIFICNTCCLTNLKRTNLMIQHYFAMSLNYIVCFHHSDLATSVVQITYCAFNNKSIIIKTVSDELTVD